MKFVVGLIGMSICLIHCAYAQMDSTAINLAQFPNKLFSKLGNKASQLDDALTRQTQKYLRKLAKKENKIREKLYKLDSNAAKNLFSNTRDKYAELSNQISSPSGKSSALTGQYAPYIDSVKGVLTFAQKSPELLNASSQRQKEINASLAEFNKLQNNFTNADQVKEFIRQRKQQMKDELQKYLQNSSMHKYLDEYNQQVYYYSEQVKEFKEALNDPDKMLGKALVILNKIPAFTHFMEQNGQLAGLFGISANYGTPQGVVGLQTRDQIQQLLNGTISAGGAGGLGAVQNNLQAAHDQLDNYKEKLSKLGPGSGDIDMPDFKPNDQKKKSFLKRLELGTNIQTSRANGYFPSQTDFGLSVGYKMNDKNTVGVGVSYNVGWGTNINHIHVTSQGISLRSFMDFQIKKNLYISGGAEANYITPFTTIIQLRTLNMWQKSGLIGLTKMVSLPGKVVKKTKIQLLWDFLSYSQIPQSEQFKFRVGYDIN